MIRFSTLQCTNANKTIQKYKEYKSSLLFIVCVIYFFLSLDTCNQQYVISCVTNVILSIIVCLFFSALFLLFLFTFARLLVHSKQIRFFLFSIATMSLQMCGTKYGLRHNNWTLITHKMRKYLQIQQAICVYLQSIEYLFLNEKKYFLCW